ncbi:nucleotide 5'-monophosphate nucleosidase PpnN [Candidatus Njordibacter sp. Uisw_002]|uniref:nucleotide 5'-monophosphate nucleosidase PpnN n=1 Tax=Candidatus Njordibacter sp. Uisw_002 TaxID=3230971 RepID=UPI003D44C440
MHTIDALISPQGSLDILTLDEINQLHKSASTGLHELFRQCCLAVLNCGSEEDDIEALLQRNERFDVEIVPQTRGVLLQLNNAPKSAFVDGEVILGIKENLYSVLRDIIYINNNLLNSEKVRTGTQLTDLVFQILRHAQALAPRRKPNIVVCWGGHSINDIEYDYTKKVGYELGLRGYDICTGCGPGAMKGPMKGAHIAHAKQRCYDYRYIGITEPGIIAAESPNAMVNELIIMPDIEKRLEAFVRLGHGFIVFPGGVGTAEEILYLLGILLHPNNAQLKVPLIFTGPTSSKAYFDQIDAFIGATLGPKAQAKYQIIIQDPSAVAIASKAQINNVLEHRQKTGDAYHYNWQLHIEDDFQHPFIPTHDNMANLILDSSLSTATLASNLRKAMSGIVAGNVKTFGLEQIRLHGPYKLKAQTKMLDKLDVLLRSFVAQNRMKLPGSKAYQPCYTVSDLET